MKKQHLANLAMLGITAGVLLTGCDNRRDNRQNPDGTTTAIIEQNNLMAAHKNCGGGCMGSPASFQGQAQAYEIKDESTGINPPNSYYDRPSSPYASPYDNTERNPRYSRRYDTPYDNTDKNLQYSRRYDSYSRQYQGEDTQNAYRRLPNETDLQYRQRMENLDRVKPYMRSDQSSPYLPQESTRYTQPYSGMRSYQGE